MGELLFDRFAGRKIIDINEMYPIICFNDNAYLTIECMWRLRDKNSILLGCIEYKNEKTHNDAHNKLTDLIIGKTIKTINLIPPLSDLCIELDNNLCIELFSDSGIYESWTLSDGRNYDLISLPGGKCCLAENKI